MTATYGLKPADLRAMSLTDIDHYIDWLNARAREREASRGT